MYLGQRVTYFLKLFFSFTLIRLVSIYTYCLFDITQKDVFCLAFYFEWKYFDLVGHILSETICLFCFCVLFSNWYPKTKFTAINWPDRFNSYSKLIFRILYVRNYFSFFAAGLRLLMSHNNIVKITEKLNKRNLWKTCLQNTFPTDLHNLHSILLWKTVKNN